MRSSSWYQALNCGCSELESSPIGAIRRTQKSLLKWAYKGAWKNASREFLNHSKKVTITLWHGGTRILVVKFKFKMSPAFFPPLISFQS